MFYLVVWPIKISGINNFKMKDATALRVTTQR